MYRCSRIDIGPGADPIAELSIVDFLLLNFSGFSKCHIKQVMEYVTEELKEKVSAGNEKKEQLELELGLELSMAEKVAIDYLYGIFKKSSKETVGQIMAHITEIVIGKTPVHDFDGEDYFNSSKSFPKGYPE